MYMEMAATALDNSSAVSFSGRTKLSFQTMFVRYLSSYEHFAPYDGYAHPEWHV